MDREPTPDRKTAIFISSIALLSIAGFLITTGFITHERRISILLFGGAFFAVFLAITMILLPAKITASFFRQLGSYLPQNEDEIEYCLRKFSPLTGGVGALLLITSLGYDGCTQHLLHGYGAPHNDVLADIMMAVGFILCTPSIIIFGEQHPKHTLVFSCPQGILTYQITSFLAKQEDIESQLAQIFASNHDVNPKNYQNALHIQVIRFDRIKPPPASPSGDPQLELDDSH